MKNRRALVTAASSGIGYAIADRLRREGAEIFITGFTEDRVRQSAKELDASGWCVADFTQPGAIEPVAAAVEVLDGIDILVSNTGGPRAAPFAELSGDDWESAYRLMLDSAIRLTREVVTGMTDRGWGRLVYITSTGIVRPLPQLHLSNVMRSGVEALARSISPEIARHGVTTHVIAPGHIDTARRRSISKFFADQQGIPMETLEEKETAGISVGRHGRPDEVANVVAFLCSEEAAFLTEQTYVVDGGVTQGVSL